MISKIVSIIMWFLVKNLQIFEIYLYFAIFPKNSDVIENFGHNFFWKVLMIAWLWHQLQLLYFFIDDLKGAGHLDTLPPS